MIASAKIAESPRTLFASTASARIAEGLMGDRCGERAARGDVPFDNLLWSHDHILTEAFRIPLVVYKNHSLLED